MNQATSAASVPVRLLGQSGCRLAFPGCTVYLDPYLSHSVEKLDAPDLKRLTPIPFAPGQVTDADWVLITHDHIDHCDPHTLPELSRASPRARFMGPPTVLALLAKWGVSADRLAPATEAWSELAPGLRIHAVPAAHPEIRRDGQGLLECVGFVLEREGRRVYLAGDTNVQQELLDSLAALAPIATAVLPVNEHNFFRGRRGIIGNMSVREAFLLADEVGIDEVVPVHWDMFAANAVGLDEIRAVHAQMRPRCRLSIQPDHFQI